MHAAVALKKNSEEGRAQEGNKCWQNQHKQCKNRNYFGAVWIWVRVGVGLGLGWELGLALRLGFELGVGVEVRAWNGDLVRLRIVPIYLMLNYDKMVIWVSFWLFIYFKSVLPPPKMTHYSLSSFSGTNLGLGSAKDSPSTVYPPTCWPTRSLLSTGKWIRMKTYLNWQQSKQTLTFAKGSEVKHLRWSTRSHCPQAVDPEFIVNAGLVKGDAGSWQLWLWGKVDRFIALVSSMLEYVCDLKENTQM